MFTYPYQILKQRLLSDVPELRDLDWYLDQDGQGTMAAAPLVYIEFLPNETKTFAGQKIQQAQTTFNLHLITDCVLETDKRMKKDAPGDHMSIFDKIFKSLQGFSAKISYLPAFVALLNTPDDQRSFASLDRIGIVPPHIRAKTKMKSTQIFRGIFYDHGGAKLYTAGTQALELTATIEV